MQNGNTKLSWATESVYGQAPAEYIMPIIKDAMLNTYNINTLFLARDIRTRMEEAIQKASCDDFILSGAL